VAFDLRDQLSRLASPAGSGRMVHPSAVVDTGMFTMAAVPVSALPVAGAIFARSWWGRKQLAGTDVLLRPASVLMA